MSEEIEEELVSGEESGDDSKADKKKKKEKKPKEKKEKKPKKGKSDDVDSSEDKDDNDDEVKNDKKEKPKKEKPKKEKKVKKPKEDNPSEDDDSEEEDKEEKKAKKEKAKKEKTKKVKKPKAKKGKGEDDEEDEAESEENYNPFAVKNNKFSLDTNDSDGGFSADIGQDEDEDGRELGKYSKLGDWSDWFGDKEKVVVDDLGNEIKIAQKKKRYVGIAPNNSNLWVVGLIGIAALLVIVLTWFMKGSAFSDDAGTIVEVAEPARYGLFDLFDAVSHGVTENSDILLFIFALSLFFGVVLRTGAIQAQIHKSLKKHKGKEHRLIWRVLIFTAIMSTFVDISWGLIAVSAYVVPLFVMAGYDILTGVLILFFGTVTGLASSIYNESTIGAFIKHINTISRTITQEGHEPVLLRADHALFVRIILFLVLLTVSYIITSGYARYIKKHPTVSPMYQATVDLRESNNEILGTVEHIPFTGKRRVILFTVVAMVVLFIMGTVPWGNMGVNAFKDFHKWANDPNTPLRVIFANIPELGTWGFVDMAGILILGLILVSVIHLFKDNELSEALTRGINAAMPTILIVMFGSAFYSIMERTGLHLTIFTNIMSAATDATKGLSFTSELIYGGFTAVFASMFPFADNITKIVTDSSYKGIVSLINANELSKLGNLGTMIIAVWGSLQPILPTSGVTIGLLEINKINYKKWVKFVFPYTMTILLISVATVTIASFVI